MSILNDILDFLEQNKNERGIKAWEKGNYPGYSYGIGLTQLKKWAKKWPKNHELANELWQQPLYEAHILACLLEQTEYLSFQDVENRLKSLHFWMLCHVYSQNVLPYVSFRLELLERWRNERVAIKKQLAFALLYYLAKSKELEDDYLLSFVDQIENELQDQENFVRDAMNNALLGIGGRSSALKERCLAAALKIGPVFVDYGDNSCRALDAVKHLSKSGVNKNQ